MLVQVAEARCLKLLKLLKEAMVLVGQILKVRSWQVSGLRVIKLLLASGCTWVRACTSTSRTN
jgi:hypothetical protein